MLRPQNFQHVRRQNPPDLTAHAVWSWASPFPLVLYTECTNPVWWAYRMDSAPYDRKVENPSFFYRLLRVIDGFPTVKRRVPKTRVATVDYRSTSFCGQTMGSLRVNYGFTYGTYVFSIAFCKFLQFSFCGHKVKVSPTVQSKSVVWLSSFTTTVFPDFLQFSGNLPGISSSWSNGFETKDFHSSVINAHAVRTKVIQHNHQISKVQAPQRSDTEPGML